MQTFPGVNYNQLWNKTQSLKANDSIQDIASTTQPMKNVLTQSFVNFKSQIQRGKLAEGYTPIKIKKGNKTPIESTRAQLDKNLEPYKPMKQNLKLIEKQYLYRRKFQQVMRKKKSSNQDSIVKRPITKEQRSKQALAKLTIYNIPKTTSYKQKSPFVSQCQSITQSTKLINQNHDVHSGFNLRKQIFQQLTETNILEKDVLADFLQRHHVFCDLYNIPKEDLKSYVKNIRTRAVNGFSEQQFHCFLINKNRLQQKGVDQPICVLGQEQWEILRLIYQSLDCFGNNKVLKQSLTTQMLKKFQTLKGKLFLKNCIFFPEVQRHYSFEKIWDIVVNSETLDYWTWDYFKSLFLDFKITKNISIDDAVFNKKFPRQYNFIVSKDFIETVKQLFNKQWVYYSLFVDKQSIYKSLKDNEKCEKFSQTFVRTNTINGVGIQTVQQALQRFNKQCGDYVDLNQILVCFSFNGRSNEDIYKHKLTLYDKKYDYSLDYKKKKIVKQNKRREITVPIQFNLSQSKKITLRQIRLQEMLRQKQQQQLVQLKKQFKALDVPLTNDSSYNIMRPSSANRASQSPIIYKPILYQQITLSQLQQLNQSRKSQIKKMTFQKYNMKLKQKQQVQEVKQKINHSQILKRSTTIPQPFHLSQSRERPPKQQIIFQQKSSPKIQDILEKMKVPTKIPVTTKYIQQVQLRKIKEKQQRQEQKQLKKQNKWKQMRRKQFSKYMHRSLPRTITKDIETWRSLQIKKEFKQMQNRLAIANEEQITQMYRRVLQKPFLFETGSTNFHSKINMKHYNLKKVHKKKGQKKYKTPQKQMQCTLDQFIQKNPQQAQTFKQGLQKHAFQEQDIEMEIQSNVQSNNQHQIDHYEKEQKSPHMQQNFIYQDQEVVSYEEPEQQQQQEEEQQYEDEQYESEPAMRHSF